MLFFLVFLVFRPPFFLQHVQKKKTKSALLPSSLVHRHLQHLGQLPALVHGDHDVAAAHEFTASIELGKRGPLGVLFEAGAQGVVFEDVDGFCVWGKGGWGGCERRRRTRDNIHTHAKTRPSLRPLSPYGTPTEFRIVTAVLEKPHWGKSRVPFMNRTTGFLARKVSSAVLSSGVRPAAPVATGVGGWGHTRPTRPAICRPAFHIAAFLSLASLSHCTLPGENVAAATRRRGRGARGDGRAGARVVGRGAASWGRGDAVKRRASMVW